MNEYFVAPTGADSNPGTLKKPFATLERAQQASRCESKRRAVTVFLREGTYYLPKTLVFTAEDSDGKVRARQLYRSEKNQVNMYHTVAVLNGAVYGFGSKSLQ